MAAVLGIGVASAVISARFLGPTGRGELAAAVAWVSVAASVAILGLDQAIAFFTAPTDRRAHAAAAGIVSAVVLGAAASLCFVAVSASSLAPVPAHVLVYSFALPSLTVLMAASNAAIGFGDFWYASGCRIATILPLPAAIAWCAVAGVTDTRTVCAAAAIGLGLVAIGAVLGFSYRHGVSLTGVPRPVFAEMFRYGVRAQLGNVAWALGSRVDQLALSLLVSSRDLGVYAAAASYAAPVLAIGTSLGPIVLRAAVRSPRLHGIPLAPLMLCGAVSLAVSIAAPIGVVAMFGEEFRPATTIAMILALSNGALAAAVVVVHAIRGYGRPLLASVSDVFNLVCGLAVVPAAIAFAGLTGAALGVAVSCCGTAAVALILLRRVSRARVSSL